MDAWLGIELEWSFSAFGPPFPLLPYVFPGGIAVLVWVRVQCHSVGADKVRAARARVGQKDQASGALTGDQGRRQNRASHVRKLTFEAYYGPLYAYHFKGHSI